MTEKYAILGHPISHSLSPYLQQAAFDEMKLNCSYQAVDTSPQLLPELLTQMRQGQWSGFNVTLPLKRQVLPLLDELTVSAIFVDEGMTMKRIKPRAKGRADRIFKRSCHITLAVAD